MLVFFCEECGGRNVIDPQTLSPQTTRIRCQVCHDVIAPNQINADLSENIFNTTNYKILIVDDEPDSLNLLYTFLENDYKVIVASNGSEALKLAAKSTPDLILLDVMMPDMDGYEVCRELKAKKETRSIPVIFVSSMSDMVDEHKGLKAGAVDYITKPISFVIARARIAIHLELKRQRDRYRKQVEKSDDLIKKLVKQNSEMTQSKAEIEQSKSFLEQALDAMRAVMMLQDASKRIIWANLAACQTFQLKRVDLIGKHCHEVLHGADAPCDNCPSLANQSETSVQPIEINNPKLDKSFKVLHAPLFDEFGELIGGVHFADPGDASAAEASPQLDAGDKAQQAAWIADISHNLVNVRDQLSIILLNSETIHELFKDNKNLSNFNKNVINSAKRLTTIFEEIEQLNQSMASLGSKGK